MINVSYLKMNGLGNDFVVMDNRKTSVPMNSDFMKSISDRTSGVGCDQVIILNISNTADIFMNIYNQDGSISGACGNATRCVADIVMKETSKDICVIETIVGMLQCTRHDNLIQVNMGIGKTNWQDIPLLSAMDSEAIELNLDMAETKKIGTGFAINFGNPHIVFLCDDAEKIDLAGLGKIIEHHPLFIERTNVEFISAITTGVIRMRVWERGGMITKACGSGACASYIASNYYGIGIGDVEVVMDGGSLFMSTNDNGEVLMRGAIEYNFKGDFSYDG